jgi:uncharacterized protein YecE (DUF72 family)
MSRLHIGLRSLEGPLERYVQRFNLVEVRLDASAAPRPSVLRKWRESAPASFLFSVVLPRVVGELRASEASEAALHGCLEAARLLQSPVIVIATPPSVRPTAANRRRLAELVERVPHDVVRLAWEPSGLWEREEAARVASQLGLTLVLDAARERLAPGPVAYTRLRGLGDARRLSASRLDQIVSNLEGRKQAYVVVETDRAALVARALRQELEHARGVGSRVARGRVHARLFETEDEEQE